jgi:hypothetical protein
MSYINDSMRKLKNREFVGVTTVLHFDITHRINNVKVTSQDSQNTREE